LELAVADPIDLERTCASLARAPDEAIERVRVRMHGAAYGMHRHDTYAVGATVGGVQAFWFRGERRVSLAGEVLVIHPDEKHDGSNGDERPLLYDMLYVSPSALAAAAPRRPRRWSPPFIPDGVRKSRSIRSIVAQAFSGFPHPLEELETVDLLGRLAQALEREGGQGEAVPAPIDWNAVSRARDLLEGDGRSAVTAVRLERATGVSRYNLARQFRLAFQVSPHQYLLGLRIREARRLIASGAPLAEVALDCGFADQSHLTRHFLRRVGLTPGRFRTALRQAGGLQFSLSAASP
jgi:AraC-like DNA-binding protein